jgi:deoxyribodipyrimidine photo-lyase
MIDRWHKGKPFFNAPGTRLEHLFDENLKPSRVAAMQRVGCVRPADYARTRNDLGGAATGLSPYLTHGLVTLQEVLSDVLSRDRLTIDHKLVYEFGWREFYRHVWAHRGAGIFQSIHPGPLPDETYSPQLPLDIRQARTGIPVIDESVRTLYATGTLHNHARMWLASYVVHVRQVHWRAGADWLVSHLLDGDLASNHLSWQWVAGTGSHKPYLFNAENVARFAPLRWHSFGTVIDRSYEELEQMARTARPQPPKGPVEAGRLDSVVEPPLLHSPPADLAPAHATIATVATIASTDNFLVRGRTVWLVHPWALRPPPADLPDGYVTIGVYPSEYHRDWPWSEARWRWVDAAMAELTPHRWFLDSESLGAALADASRVRTVADPHLPEWQADLEPAPALFPLVERPCASFSQWWSRATRGIEQAGGLL